MKLRYEQLFSITLGAGYHDSAAAFADLVLQPTTACSQLMNRFNIRTKTTPSGLLTYYQCSPFTNDTTPFKPVTTAQTFSFLLKAVNPSFWYLADVNNWKQDSIFHLKNPFFDTTGNIAVHNGPLSTPVSFRPMLFKHSLTLENTGGVLEVRDATGVLIKAQPVRALVPPETPGTTEEYLVDLKGFTEGAYTLRHIKAGPPADTKCYCSADCQPGALAVVDIQYKGDVLWTGKKPFQNYTVTVAARKTNWFFDVHVNAKSLALYKPSKLTVNHKNILPDPKQTFSVDGAADDVNGLVKFKSDAPVAYPAKPMQLELVHNGAKIIISQLPLPNQYDVQKDILNNFFTNIIVNV
jgi:hypothetical protein